MPYTETSDFNTVIRTWAQETKNWHGAQGGWIYNSAGRTVSQGWQGVFMRYRRDILDWLTRRETAFDSFKQMVEETHSSYRPTIFQTNAFRRMLSDQYDSAQMVRMDPRRTFRGTRSRA